jgi:hypothetical protein
MAVGPGGATPHNIKHVYNAILVAIYFDHIKALPLGTHFSHMNVFPVHISSQIFSAMS